MDFVQRSVGDRRGQSAYQEPLMVIGISVRSNRAVCVRGIRRIATGQLVVAPVEVRKRVIGRVDLIIQSRKENVLFADARIAPIQAKQVSNGGGALGGCDGGGTLCGGD